MKVMVVAEQLRRRVPGGIGTYAAGLLSGLAAVDHPGVEIALLAGRPGRRSGGPSGRSPEYARPAADPLAPWGLPIEAGPLPGRGLVRLWDHGRARPRRPHDVLHAVSQAFPVSAAPLSVMVHDLSYRHFPDAFPPRGRRWHEASLARVVARAAVVIAPSRATAEDLAAEGARRTEVIEHGADHLPPPDTERTAGLLGRLGIGGPFLLSVGTLEPRKNLSGAMAGYTRARSRLPEPWPLLVVGPAGWGPGVEPVEGAVMAGAVDDAVLAGLYASARCLVYVPLLEGFGLPPVEAMAHGLPVVVSPMPGPGGEGLEVAPGDPEEIAQALVLAATDGPLRDQLIEKGRRRAAGLTWAASARRHLEVWESLC
ncbi:MAG: glycosyltransferase family 4 protein [Acidimicrobiales bacterium]